MGQAFSSAECDPAPADDTCTPRAHTLKLLTKQDWHRAKKLIRSGVLAPVTPCNDDEMIDMHLEAEECPICMEGFVALNTASCCSKQLCTDCFIQVHATAPIPGTASCPFCKAGSLRVRFLGVRSAEERLRDAQHDALACQAQRSAAQAQFTSEQEQTLRRLEQQGSGSSRAVSSGVGSSAAKLRCSSSPSGSTRHGGSSTTGKGKHGAAFASDKRRMTGSSAWQVAPERDTSPPEVQGAALLAHAAMQTRMQQAQRQQQEQMRQQAATLQLRAAVAASSAGASRGRLPRSGYARRNLQRLAASQLVPPDMAELTLSLEDIEQMMLEEALMASMAGPGGGSGAAEAAPVAAQPVRAATPEAPVTHSPGVVTAAS